MQDASVIMADHLTTFAIREMALAHVSGTLEERNVPGTKKIY